MKSAVFGGKLTVFKSSKANSKVSQDQFASAAEEEFSAMMSTLDNSFQQVIYYTEFSALMSRFDNNLEHEI